MKCAIILSGCGVRDGSEIHESVTAMLSLDGRGHAYDCYALDKAQSAVVDHYHGSGMRETRNMLVEAARIARGQIRDVKALDLAQYDAVVLPGGFGAATNLCDFGSRGAACTVDPDLEDVLVRAHEAGKAIGFMCIAPVIAARVFGKNGVQMTIGDDAGTASACEAMGAKHVVCKVDEACVDKNLKIVTVPAYMTARSITECYLSAQAMVRALEELV